MKLKWKKFRKLDSVTIKKWIKKNPGIVTKTTSSIFEEYKYFSKQNEYKCDNNVFIFRIHHNFKYIGFIALLKEGLELIIKTLLINPKYDYFIYGKAIIDDLIKNNVLITNKLVNRISVGITSDNYYALKLLKALNFKFDRIHPDDNSFNYIYKL